MPAAVGGTLHDAEIDGDAVRTPTAVTTAMPTTAMSFQERSSSSARRLARSVSSAIDADRPSHQASIPNAKRIEATTATDSRAIICQRTLVLTESSHMRVDRDP